MAAPTSTYVKIAGPQARVMLGTGAASVTQASQRSGQPSGVRQVVVTPLTTQPQVPRTTISKVLIKAVKSESNGKRAEGKTFTLRDIDPSKVDTCYHLKSLIRAQLQEDIRKGDFDVGYIQNSSVVTLRSPEDMQEVWSSLSKGTKVTLWCDGLRGSASSSKSSRKRGKQQKQDDSEDEDSDAEPSSKSRKKTKNEEKDQEIQKLIEDLKSTHNDNYTTMQYRIWSEMIIGGLHKSTDTAPSNPLFLRAGGNYPKKKPISSGDVLTQAVTDIASALVKSRPTPSPSSVVHSPAKIIDGRSKCYRQLSELKSLVESGLLSDEEYQVEREAIMNTLKKLAC